ncbi:MAG: esterase [Spirochaetes bacterium]|nr:MAG: esterase [Spirochaetota bacterium]
MKKIELSRWKTGLGKAGLRATMPLSLPYEIHPEDARKAVLVLHGYTGGPSDLRYLAGCLADAGFAVSVPRLPGAGTDMDDLSNTSRRDWMRRACDAWQDLRSRYETVYILGYSMGGLLALELAKMVKSEKTVLLAPALITSHKSMRFLPLLLPLAGVLPRKKTGWEPKDEDSEERREHGRRYWAYRDLKSAAQLSLLQGEVVRHLGGIRTAVMAIVSSEDKTVPAKVLELLEKRLPSGLSATLVVKNCGHNIPQGPDREKVADAVIAWL